MTLFIYVTPFAWFVFSFQISMKRISFVHFLTESRNGFDFICANVPMFSLRIWIVGIKIRYGYLVVGNYRYHRHHHSFVRSHIYYNQYFRCCCFSCKPHKNIINCYYRLLLVIVIPSSWFCYQHFQDSSRIICFQPNMIFLQNRWYQVNCDLWTLSRCCKGSFVYHHYTNHLDCCRFAILNQSCKSTNSMVCSCRVHAQWFMGCM